VDEVFIKNNENSNIINHPIRIPMSFQDGEYTTATISNVKIGNLPTQVQPTSFYKNGSVKTGVAWVLDSLNAGQEKIYQIGEGNSGTFQYDPKVFSFLTGGNFRSVVKDIKGQEYEVVIDLDDLEPQFYNVLVNGPVVKILEIKKRHEPVANGELPYLMTSVVYITLITGKDYFLVDHILVNSNNLEEDAIASETGGLNNGRLYRDGQHGVIFYTNAKLEIDTTPENSSVYLLDSRYVDPSYVQNVSPTNNTFWIMNTKAQETISGLNIGLGVPLSGDFTEQSNYIGGGQGLLSRLVVSFGNPITKHPLEEYNIQSGQSLERFNLADAYFFQEFPDPNAINPNYNFTNPATNHLNGIKGLLNQNDKGIRWGLYDYGTKDMGSSGYGFSMYFQEPVEAVRFMFSCGKRCANDYIKSLRFHLYGAAQLTNYFVGFDAEDHPLTNMDYYRTSFFEATDWDYPWDIKCGGPWSPKDFIGFCQDATPPTHRTDAFGKTHLDYVNAYRNAGLGNRIWWHGWTGREPAHLSLGMEGYRYMFTGDPAALFLFESQLQSAAISPFRYYTNPNGGAYGAGLTGRARGRSLKALSLGYSIQHDPFYKQMAEDLITVSIAFNRDHQEPGSRGQNPATGDDYPVKYYSGFAPFVQNVTKMQIFEHYQISHGLATAYREIFGPGDTSIINTIKQTVQDGLFFAWNYAYKSPDRILNGKPYVNGANRKVNEGYPGFASYNILIVGQDESKIPPEDVYNTYYPGNQQQEIYPGICNEMRMAGLIKQGDPSFLPDYDEYFEEWRKDFLRVWITPKKANVFTQPDTWSINFDHIDDEYLCGLTYFMQIPNAAGISYYNSQAQTISPGTCVDNDNDEFSTCAGDCNDSNPNINPGQGETSCTDGVDNNCNDLVDCNDPTCTTAGGGGGHSSCNNGSVLYCGDSTVQDPNDFGTAEECDRAPWTSGANNCPNYQCVPPYTQFANSCACSESAGLTLGNVNPNTFFEEESVSLTLAGSGFSSAVEVVIDSEAYTPDTVDAGTGTIALNLDASETGAIGEGVHTIFLREGEDSNPMTITVLDSTPLLNSVIPDNADIGFEQVITLNGSNFMNSAQVKIGSLPLIGTTHVSNSQLTFVLTENATSQLGSGTHNLYVQNIPGRISNSQTLTITVPEPDAPTNLTADLLQGTNDIVLNWNDNADDEQRYHLERSIDGFIFIEIESNLPIDTETYTDMVSGYGTFYYRVRASNEGGYSDYSNTANETIEDPGPDSEPDVLSIEITSPISELDNNETAFIPIKIDKLHPFEDGYLNMATMKIMTICQLDHAVSEYAVTCQNTDTWDEIITMLYVDNPIYNETFVNRKASNYNSSYPGPQNTIVEETGNYIPEEGTEADYEIDPTVLGLANGTYRLFALIGSGQYVFSPDFNSTYDRIETELSNNLVLLEFAIADPSTDNGGDEEDGNDGDDDGDTIDDGNGGDNGDGGNDSRGGSGDGNNDNGEDNVEDGSGNDRDDSNAIPLKMKNLKRPETFFTNFLGHGLISSNPILLFLYSLLSLFGFV
jgi:hypothetical protein